MDSLIYDNQQTQSEPRPTNRIQLPSRFFNEAARFFALGLIALGLDVLIFTVLLLAGVPADISKGIGYALGLVFTLLFVFPSVFSTRSSARLLGGGVLIYIWSGLVNVWTFSVIFSAEASVPASLLISTAVSASMNFILLRGLLAFGNKRRRY